MKILFFDYWLKGVANFNRLIPELRRQCPAAEVKMLHVGSWKEPQEKKVNEHNGFKSYDISFYNTSSIYKVLKKERPDVVVILNIYLLLDKAIIAFCKKMGIKVVFVAHGRLSSTKAMEEGNARRKKPKKTLKSKLKKEPLFTLANYWNATRLHNKPGRFLHTLKEVARHSLSIVYPIKYDEELEADEIMVYYESDRDILNREKGFPEEKIKVTGNPELDAFVNQPIIERKEFYHSSGIDASTYLLYLDDGWVEANLITKKAWKNHLREITQLAKETGLKLVMKLHPRTPLEQYADFFTELGIKAFKNEVDFKSLIYYSQNVTSLASTTMSMALFLQKRVISPRFGEVGEVFRNYPEDVVHYSTDPLDFKEWLKKTDATATNTKYLDDNFRLCDGKATQRIVKEILNEHK